MIIGGDSHMVCFIKPNILPPVHNANSPCPSWILETNPQSTATGKAWVAMIFITTNLKSRLVKLILLSLRSPHCSSYADAVRRLQKIHRSSSQKNSWLATFDFFVSFRLLIRITEVVKVEIDIPTQIVEVWTTLAYLVVLEAIKKTGKEVCILYYRHDVNRHT